MSSFTEQSEAMARSVINSMAGSVLECLTMNGRLGMAFLEFVASKSTIVKYREQVTILRGRIDYAIVSMADAVNNEEESTCQSFAASSNLTHLR